MVRDDALYHPNSSQPFNVHSEALLARHRRLPGTDELGPSTCRVEIPARLPVLDVGQVQDVVDLTLTVVACPEFMVSEVYGTASGLVWLTEVSPLPSPATGDGRNSTLT